MADLELPSKVLPQAARRGCAPRLPRGWREPKAAGRHGTHRELRSPSGAPEQLVGHSGGARRRCSVPCCPLAAVRHQVSGLPQHLEDPRCHGPPTLSRGWGEASSPLNLKSICWGLNPVAP